jgi:hypothetical protein
MGQVPQNVRGVSHVNCGLPMGLTEYHGMSHGTSHGKSHRVNGPLVTMNYTMDQFCFYLEEPSVFIKYWSILQFRAHPLILRTSDILFDP